MLCEAHRCRSGPARLAGFTVIELLVVVAIISVLLSILLPSLKAARRQAQGVLCAARLKQWGVAFEAYAAENSGVWPHCDGLDRNPLPLDHPHIGKEDVADWFGWVDVLPPMIHHSPWRDYETGDHPTARSFYQCPTARLTEPPSLYAYYPRQQGYFSYAMSSCLELDNNAYPPPGGSDYPMPSFLDTARIVRPPQVVLLFDQLLDPYKGYGGTTPYRDAGQYCGSYPIAFAARHRRNASLLGGNILFCDGHVDWQRTVWKAEWGDWDISHHQQGPPRDDLNWYPYPAELAP